MAHYLITGGAGFIGSHLVRGLLERGASVRVLDDFSTGRRENLAEIASDVDLVEGSIEDRELLARVFKGVEYCVHLAALPSVPRSVASPWQCNRVNVEGAVNVFLAARDAGTRRVVAASSSSVYGNGAPIPTREGVPVSPLSPYGVSKAAMELYGGVFAELYGLDIVALRYFNVFGPRQDPESRYAAVIPAFIGAMLRGERPRVDGDGHQGRDFTYVGNVVDANLKVCAAGGRVSGVYNVACGETMTILELVSALNRIVGRSLEPVFGPARIGDVRCSCADIGKACAAFGYRPEVSVVEGLARTVEWFARSFSRVEGG